MKNQKLKQIEKISHRGKIIIELARKEYKKTQLRVEGDWLRIVQATKG